MKKLFVYRAFSDRFVDAEAVEAADRLIKAKKTKGIWGVTRVAIDVWKKQNPERWDTQLITVQDLKKTRARRSGASKSLGTRYLIDIPQKIIDMIRVLYPPEELKMDVKFWRTFAKKFPEFTVAEKV